MTRTDGRPATMPSIRVGRRREWIPVAVTAPTVWLATADGLVSLDLIAVELAANGEREGRKLTSQEAAFTADLLRRRGVDCDIPRLIGVSGSTFRKWFPDETTPLHEALARIQPKPDPRTLQRKQRLDPSIRCGTYPGVQRHKRQKEPLCEPCRQARLAAERHYREHGTYKGAPEPVAMAS